MHSRGRVESPKLGLHLKDTLRGKGGSGPSFNLTRNRALILVIIVSSLSLIGYIYYSRDKVVTSGDHGAQNVPKNKADKVVQEEIIPLEEFEEPPPLDPQLIPRVITDQLSQGQWPTTKDGDYLFALPQVGRVTEKSAVITLVTAGNGHGALKLNTPKVCVLDNVHGNCSKTLRLKEYPDSLKHIGGYYVEYVLTTGLTRVTAHPLDIPSERTYIELRFHGLVPATHYAWTIELLGENEGEDKNKQGAAQIYQGEFATQRPINDEGKFSFLVFADTHLFTEQYAKTIPSESTREWAEMKPVIEKEFRSVAEFMNKEKVDFSVCMGDSFDAHGLGFCPPFTHTEAVIAHNTARSVFAEALNNTGAIFHVVGNWEGESGCHPSQARDAAMSARMMMQVNPNPHTYPFGGSDTQDYYAFAWGNMFGLVLNVLGYDETCHQFGQTNPGKTVGTATSFTLGVRQKAFALKSLRRAATEYKYRLVFVHHTVGGNAVDKDNTNYGRGAYRAAQVGEQKWLHQLMRETGVQIIFLGHDHVFTSGKVDGIQYLIPGTPSAPWRFIKETGYTHQGASTESGYARVDVSTDKLTVNFLTKENKVIKEFTALPAKLQEKRPIK